MTSPPPPYWWAEPDALTCRYGHPIGRVMREDEQYFSVRGACTWTITCRKCTPATYAFAMQVHEPEPFVLLWSCRTREDMERARRMWDDKVRLVYILAELGYQREEAA